MQCVQQIDLLQVDIRICIYKYVNHIDTNDKQPNENSDRLRPTIVMIVPLHASTTEDNMVNSILHTSILICIYLVNG